MSHFNDRRVGSPLTALCKWFFFGKDTFEPLKNIAGHLNMSDKSRIQNKIAYQFLGREFHKKYLRDNWYWVDCYVDWTLAVIVWRHSAITSTAYQGKSSTAVKNKIE
jgi:hypothetical protein